MLIQNAIDDDGYQIFAFWIVLKSSVIRDDELEHFLEQVRSELPEWNATRIAVLWGQYVCSLRVETKNIVTWILLNAWETHRHSTYSKRFIYIARHLKYLYTVYPSR